MNAQEIIDYIANSEKKTPVKVYVNTTGPVDFGSAQVFGSANAQGGGSYVVFGDWSELGPILEANADRITDTVVENDVWIGQNVTILPGVHIGSGAIIGANSVVSKDVPPYCIAAGNPARIVRKRFDEETVAFLLDLRWWDWPPERIFENLDLLCSGDIEKLKQLRLER